MLTGHVHLTVVNHLLMQSTGEHCNTSRSTSNSLTSVIKTVFLNLTVLQILWDLREEFVEGLAVALEALRYRTEVEDSQCECCWTRGETER